jgi:ABC-type multidrug transport system permease subunit
VSSVVFVIPFFFIVGFDHDGVTDKFFWYWLFQCLYITTMVFLGHFLASALPNQATCAVIGGMLVLFIALFGGFMIKAVDFPDFWIFM